MSRLIKQSKEKSNHELQIEQLIFIVVLLVAILKLYADPIEIIIYFDLHHDGKTKETFVPTNITCHTATNTASAPVSPQEKKKATQTPAHALDSSKTIKGSYSNLLSDLVHTDIPGYQNFVRMPPAFFSHH